MQLKYERLPVATDAEAGGSTDAPSIPVHVTDLDSSAAVSVLEVDVEVADKPVSNPCPCCGRLTGLLLMALSALLFSVSALMVSMLGGRIASFMIVCYRSITVWLFCVVALLVQGRSLFGRDENRRILILRALIGFLGMSCYFYALTHLSLGEATVVIFTAPSWTAFLARWLLKEKLTCVQIGAIILSLSGVVLVAQADSSQTGFGEEVDNRVLGLGIGLIGSIASAFTNIVIRKLKSEHPYVVVNYFSFFGMIMSPLLGVALQDVSPPEGLDWLWFVVMGFLGFAGQSLKTKSFQLEKAAPAAMIRCTDVFYAFGFQTILLHQAVSPWSAAGAALIVTGTVTIGLEKLRQGRQSPAPVEPEETLEDSDDDEEETITLVDSEALSVEMSDLKS